MISTEAAGLAIAVAKGLIKLAGRADRLLAEKEAVTSELVIPMPPVSPTPDREIRTQMLVDYLARTAGMEPDPLGGDRKKLAAIVAKDPVPDTADVFFERIFPEEFSRPAILPEAEYLKALHAFLPSVNWQDKANDDLRKAAFFLAAGRKAGLSYGARLGLLVADTIAEFGAENSSLFVRNKNLQTIVSSVLTRFAEPDLEDFDEWSPFLRHVLNSTLNGLLDARQVFANHAKWVDALMEALALAREEAENPDEFLFGLVQGEGYSLLLGVGMQMAGQQLAGDQANQFKAVAADFLVEASKLVKGNQKGFAGFFREHWGDLLRGGLKAVAKQGPKLLEGQSPLLQKTLEAVIEQLSNTADSQFLTADTAAQLVEAALGAIAQDPDVLKGKVGDEWLRTLIASVAGTLAEDGLRKAFSHQGLEDIVKHALTTFAEHPELIVHDAGLAQEVVANVLLAVAKSESLEIGPLASAAVSSALLAVSKHPEIAGTQFGPFVAELAGQLSEQVAANGLTSLQAADIISASVTAMLRNPQLFAKFEDNVAAVVVQAVLKAVGESDGLDGQIRLVTGAALVQAVGDVLATVARYGQGFVENKGVKELGARLTEVISAALARAGKELGRRLDQPAVSQVLVVLVRKLLRGELGEVAADNENFKKLFSEIAEAVNA